MTPNKTFPSVLSHLTHRNWISGPKLAEAMGISRAAIWKQIKLLHQYNIEVEHSHKGYRLNAPLILYNQDLIKHSIHTPQQSQGYHLEILPSVDSTNLQVKRHTQDNEHFWKVCLSEQQTAGRGRLGRQWNSPFAENIYLSIGWKTALPLAKLSGLSIAISLAIQQALMPWVPDCQIKWPNDVLYQGQKLAGTLIELMVEPHGISQVIIGIGINVNTLTSQHPLTDQPHCSIRDIKDCYINRHDIVIPLINQCLETISNFEKRGLEPLLPQWHAIDYLINKDVTIYQGLQTVSGIAKGVNSLGYLILETAQGERIEVPSGEASLKRSGTDKGV